MADTCTTGHCSEKATKMVRILHSRSDPAWYPYCDKDAADNDWWKKEGVWGGVRDLKEKPQMRQDEKDLGKYETHVIKREGSIYQDPPQAYVNYGRLYGVSLVSSLLCKTCNGKGTIRKPLFNLMYDEPCGDCSG